MSALSLPLSNMKGGMERLLVFRRFRLQTTSRDKQRATARRSERQGRKPLRLDTLPEDVLFEILEFCSVTPVALKSLSETNWHLRQLCVPVLFRHVVWRIDNIPGLLKASHLIDHVRTLEIAFTRYPKRDYKNVLLSLIPLFERVTTLVLGEAIFSSSICMEQLLRLPRLETIRVQTAAALQHTLLPHPLTVHPTLKRLEYTCWTPGSVVAGGPEGDLRSRQLTAVIGQCCATLEHLNVPSRLVQWAELASVQFPNLKHLHTAGLLPQQPRPFLSVLVHAPALRSLDVRFLEGLSTPWSEDIISSLSTISPDFHSLDTLRLSSLALQDIVVPHLPEHTRTLSLISYPHPLFPWHGRYRSTAAYIRDCPSLLSLLRTTRLPGLQVLEISVRGVMGCDFVSGIVSAFPELVELELHRYDSPGSFDPRHCPSMPLLAESLQGAPSLKELRLNLNTDNFSSPTSDPSSRPSPSHLTQLASCIQKLPVRTQQLVSLLPALERVMFLLPFGEYLANHRWVCFDSVRGEGGERRAVARMEGNRFAVVRAFNRNGS